MSIGKPNSKTFCPAPWFQIRNRNNRIKKCCCKIQLDDSHSLLQTPLEYLNSDKLKEIKEKLHNGVKPEECTRCWLEEDKGFKSQRQNLLGALTNDKGLAGSWIESYFKQKDNYESDFLVAADIKIGNTCNFNCIMCKPEDSSQIYNDWIKRQDSEFVQERIKEDKDYFSKIKDQGYKNNYYRQYLNEIFNTTNNLLWLRLLGGEPLLDKNLLKKIKDLPDEKKKKLKLSFITNGSIDLTEVLNFIEGKKFNYIQINISLEGTDEVQEYARYGSDWKQIEQNILNVQSYSNNLQLNLSYVIQTPTILRLKNLLEWAKSHNLFFGISPCITPEYLSLKTLPQELRAQVKKDLMEFTDVIKQNPNQDEGLGTLSGQQFVNIIDDPAFVFDRELFEKYKRYIKWYEANKNIPRLSEVIPEWQEYFI